jgi:hypothetical protein
LTLEIAQITANFDKYIVRPLNAFGLGGFVFDVEGESTVTLTSEITDHFTEDNAVQDHIAIRPKRVILRNYVGELVFRLDPDNDTPLQKVVQKLTILNGYLPELSDAASQAKSVYENGIGNLNFDIITGANVSKAVDLWALVKNLTPPISRQEQAYMYFKALQEQKIIVSVQTPFEYMTNMAVESVISFQDDNSRFISDFSITLKEIRTAPTILVSYDQSNVRSNSNVNAQSNLPDGTPIKPAAISLPTGTGNLSNAPATKEQLNQFKSELSERDLLRPLDYQGSSSAQVAPVKNNGRTSGIALPTPLNVNDLKNELGSYFK